MKIVPTSKECNIIRRCARNVTGKRGLVLEPGVRYNVDFGSDVVAMNIALITSDPYWDDTDLATHVDWEVFKRGFDLSGDGRGIIDFYVSSNIGLETNVTAYFDAKGMTRVEETCRGEIWRR